MTKDYDKEAIYAKEIQPLIQQLLDKCKKHEIPLSGFVQYSSKEEGINIGNGTFVSDGDKFTGWLSPLSVICNEGSQNKIPSSILDTVAMVAMAQRNIKSMAHEGSINIPDHVSKQEIEKVFAELGIVPEGENNNMLCLDPKNAKQLMARFGQMGIDGATDVLYAINKAGEQ